MLMSLGMFVFDLPTLAYDELARRSSYRHATTPRVGVRDAAQFTGLGEETIQLGGSVYLEIADGDVQIDTLRDMAAEGAPLPMVDAGGRVWGSFVITTLDDKRRAFLPDGRPRRIDFDINLLRVDDPAPAA